MDKKIKLFIVAQLIVIVTFAFLALNCGGSSYTPSSSSGSYSSSSSSSSSTVKSLARSFAQGANCGANGFTYIGAYDTNTKCAEACGAKGYSLYCTGEDTYACYCK